MPRIEPKGFTQVVPDNWYVVLQKVERLDEWRECGRLDVRNLTPHSSKISETWYLHTTDGSAGYGGKPRAEFRRLGVAGSPELDSIRLVRIAKKKAGNEPTISHHKIVCICDPPVLVELSKSPKAVVKKTRARSIAR